MNLVHVDSARVEIRMGFRSAKKKSANRLRQPGCVGVIRKKNVLKMNVLINRKSTERTKRVEKRKLSNRKLTGTSTLKEMAFTFYDYHTFFVAANKQSAKLIKTYFLF